MIQALVSVGNLVTLKYRLLPLQAVNKRLYEPHCGLNQTRTGNRAYYMCMNTQEVCSNLRKYILWSYQPNILIPTNIHLLSDRDDPGFEPAKSVYLFLPHLPMGQGIILKNEELNPFFVSSLAEPQENP